MQIAFFDSGIGGLTVLHQARRKMPQENFLYYADTDHVPYGRKTKVEIRRYVQEAVDFIAQQDVKALVVACNTATSVAIQACGARYSFPIFGMEPAVKPAVNDTSCTKRILVTATPGDHSGGKAAEFAASGGSASSGGSAAAAQVGRICRIRCI